MKTKIKLSMIDGQKIFFFFLPFVIFFTFFYFIYFKLFQIHISTTSLDVSYYFKNQMKYDVVCFDGFCCCSCWFVNE